MKWNYLYKSMAAALVISLAAPGAVLAQTGGTEMNLQAEGETPAPAPTEAETSAPAPTEAETPAPEPPPTETPTPEPPPTEAPSTEPITEPATIATDLITEPTDSDDPGKDSEAPTTPADDEIADSSKDDETKDSDEPAKDRKDDEDSGKNRKHNKDDMDKEPVNYNPGERFSQIVTPGSVKTSFRFKTVDKEYGLAKADETKVYGMTSITAKAVGRLNKDDICYILEDSKDDFYYIESGNVRGFVRKTEIETGSLVDKKIRLKGEMRFMFGKATVAPSQNPAWDYLKVTTEKTLVDKEYAVVSAEGSLSIREGRHEDSRAIGKVPTGGLCYILADAEKDWVYVESSNVRGFVKREYLTMGKEAEQTVEEKGEENFSLASQQVEPEENKACYYTLTSVKEPLDAEMEFLGDFTLTSYCSCPVCCGQWSGGPTASGAFPVQGKTVAMGGVAFGTKLVINGEVYTVEDRGTPYGHVDVYKVNHSEAAMFGRQKAPVYLLKDAAAEETLEANAAE